MTVKVLCGSPYRGVYDPRSPVPGGLGTVAPAFISSALISMVAGMKGPGLDSLPVVSINACLYPRVLFHEAPQAGAQGPW